jgi:hypothetical protein
MSFLMNSLEEITHSLVKFQLGINYHRSLTSKKIPDFFGVHGDKVTFGKKFGGLQGMNTINALNSAPKKGPAQVIELPVTLEELYNGGLHKYTVTRKVTPFFGGFSP